MINHSVIGTFIRKNKLRWYPQRFNSRNVLFFCEAKRWNSVEPVGTWPGPASKIPKTFSGLLCNLLRPSLQPSPEPCWTWPGCAKASQTFSGTFSGTLLSLTWLCTNASWNLIRNLLRNPVEPDLALHQTLPDLLRNLFRNLLRNPVELDLALHQGFLEPSPEPSPEPCWTWPGPAPLHTGAILGWRPH